MENIFLSKKKKEERKALAEQALLEERKEKEIQTRIKIKKTLREMKSQSAKLESVKADYIEKARNSELVNNNQACSLAKNGIKLCISRQRFLDSMIVQYEMALQMKDMNKIVSSFVKSMNIISTELKGITSEEEITKTQTEFEEAMYKNEDQFDAIQELIDQAEESIKSFAGNSKDVTDEEIDELIHNQAADSESKMNSDIDEQLKALREAY